MPITKLTFTDQIKAMVRDTSQRLEPLDYDNCLGKALERYSQDRPPSTGLHVVDDDGSTVYASDFYAVCSLAAAHACGLLASEFIPSVDKSPQVDFASLQSKVDHYRSRRRDFLQEYVDHLKLVGVESGFIFGSIDTNWIEGANASEV